MQLTTKVDERNLLIQRMFLFRYIFLSLSTRYCRQQSKPTAKSVQQVWPLHDTLTYLHSLCGVYLACGLVGVVWFVRFNVVYKDVLLLSRSCCQVRCNRCYQITDYKTGPCTVPERLRLSSRASFCLPLVRWRAGQQRRYRRKYRAVPRIIFRQQLRTYNVKLRHTLGSSYNCKQWLRTYYFELRLRKV